MAWLSWGYSSDIFTSSSPVLQPGEGEGGASGAAGASRGCPKIFSDSQQHPEHPSSSLFTSRDCPKIFPGSQLLFSHLQEPSQNLPQFPAAPRGSQLLLIPPQSCSRCSQTPPGLWEWLMNPL